MQDQGKNTEYYRFIDVEFGVFTSNEIDQYIL